MIVINEVHEKFNYKRGSAFNKLIKERLGKTKLAKLFKNLIKDEKKKN